MPAPTEIPEAAAPIIATPASEAAAMPAAPVSPLNLDANEAGRSRQRSGDARRSVLPFAQPVESAPAKVPARWKPAPFLANQQIPVEFQPADAAAPAAAAPVSNFEATGFPVAEPAELNALEPVEPTAAQAAAVTAQTERSSTTGTAAHEEAAVMLPAAEILNERPHKRPGRPPKKMTVAPACTCTCACIRSCACTCTCSDGSACRPGPHSYWPVVRTHSRRSRTSASPFRCPFSPLRNRMSSMPARMIHPGRQSRNAFSPRRPHVRTGPVIQSPRSACPSARRPRGAPLHHPGPSYADAAGNIAGCARWRNGQCACG